MNTWIITRGGTADVTVAHNTAHSLVNYTADGVNPNYLASGNITAAPTAAGDLSALKAWLSAHAGLTTSLTGGEGTDILTGGAGSDVFSIGKVPTAAVQITDFTAGQDKLDLHTLLANYHGTDPLADKWVQFQSTSGGLNVLVDVDGPSGSAGLVTVA